MPFPGVSHYGSPASTYRSPTTHEAGFFLPMMCHYCQRFTAAVRHFSPVASFTKGRSNSASLSLVNITVP